MSRDIRISPNLGTTASNQFPKIDFRGVSQSFISLKVDDDGSVVYTGTYGVLFNITDSKDGLLHSVNDISGLPILQVYSNDYVQMGKWDKNTLVVNSDKVGVGMTAPSYKLDVNSNNSNVFRLSAISTFNNSLIDSDGYSSSLSIRAATVAPVGGYNAGVYLYSNVNTLRGSFNAESTTSVTTLESTGGYWLLLKHGSSESIGLGQGGNYIQFSTNGSTKMIIDGASGNVGIGTTSPATKLHIDGASGSNVQIYLKSTGVDNGIQIDSGEYPFFTMKSNGVSNLTMQGIGGNTIIFRPSQSVQWRDNANNSLMGSVGFDNPSSSYSYFMHNLGVGVSTPSSRLHIIGIDNSSNYAVKVESASASPLLFVRNDGNLGVRVSSPSASLHIKNSGTQSSLSYLVENADGDYLLYGNESGTYTNISNNGFIIQKNSIYGLNGTFIGTNLYGPLDIGIGGLGAYISLSHNNSDTTIWTSTTIGGSSRGDIGYTARVGISGDGTLGVRNIGFAYNGNNGSTIYAIGNEDDGLNTSIRIKYIPTQFGYSGTGSSAESNNSWRIGVGTASISTHRVAISEGLKVVGNGIDISENLSVVGLANITPGPTTSSIAVGGTLCEYTNDGSSVGTSMTTLYTTSGLVNTANLLSRVGDRFKGVFAGYFTGDPTSTKSVHLYYGGNDLFGTTAITYSGTTYWRIEFTILRYSISTQIRHEVTITTYDTSTGESKIEQTSGAYDGFDFTSDMAIELKGQSVGAGTIDGDVISRMGYIDYNPAKI